MFRAGHGSGVDGCGSNTYHDKESCRGGTFAGTRKALRATFCGAAFERRGQCFSNSANAFEAPVKRRGAAAETRKWRNDGQLSCKVASRRRWRTGGSRCISCDRKRSRLRLRFHASDGIHPKRDLKRVVRKQCRSGIQRFRRFYAYRYRWASGSDFVERRSRFSRRRQ